MKELATQLNERYGPYGWSFVVGEMVAAAGGYYVKGTLEICHREARDLAAVREAWAYGGSPEKATEACLDAAVLLLGNAT